MQTKLAAILARSVTPFCIFSLVLLGSVGLIKVAVVPLLTRVEIDGEQQQLASLLEQHAELTAELTTAEDERSALVMPVQDERYRALRDGQQVQQELQSVFAVVQQLMQEAQRQEKPVIVLHEMTLNYDEQSLHMVGDVRNVGSSSTSVLAWFMDSLRAVPLLMDTPSPAFQREEDPYIGQYSSFDIVIPLRVHE